MERKKYKTKYDRKINKKDKVIKKVIDIKWLVKIVIMAFIITVFCSVGADSILKQVNIAVGLLITFIFVIVGVVADMVGIAVAKADEEPFHSMAAKKIKGARIAIKMIKNAEKVAAVCADVIGDVCGVMSGSAAIVVANSLSVKYSINPVITILLITSLVAASIVGGKATGKSLAINKSEVIVYEFAKLCSIFYK